MPPLVTYLVPGVLLLGAVGVFAVSARMELQGQSDKARVLRLAALFDALLAVALFVFFHTR